MARWILVVEAWLVVELIVLAGRALAGQAAALPPRALLLAAVALPLAGLGLWRGLGQHTRLQVDAFAVDSAATAARAESSLSKERTCYK